MCNNITHLLYKGSKEDWEIALENYWNKVSEVNFNLEKEFEQLNIKAIKSMSTQQFYIFLHDKYFVWKYTAKNRLGSTRKQLIKYEIEDKIAELDQIHKQLFMFDLSNVKEGLQIASKIHGLGIAGASGLLSLLFPNHFGTVDQFVVKSLCSIEKLPEHNIFAKMNPDSLNF